MTCLAESDPKDTMQRVTDDSCISSEGIHGKHHDHAITEEVEFKRMYAKLRTERGVVYFAQIQT